MKAKKSLSILGSTLLLFAFLLTLSGCPGPDPDPKKGKFPLGWNSKEDFSSTPVSLNTNLFGPSSSSEAMVDLRKYMPPIGDQQSFGTCVAWAVGYYSKSAIEAVTRGIPQSQLSNVEYEMSPKDLYYSIDDNKKGANCDGTNFSTAMDQLINRGVATLATVPYINLGNCSVSGTDPAWSTDASNHKIRNYRRLDVSINAIKEQLSINQPVIIGVDVYNSFEQYDGGIYSSNSGSVLGGHALTVAGYDDNLGAFLVVNSWGNQWGDNGVIWVEYNFMVNGFITGGNAYVMSDGDNNNPVDPVDPVTPVTGSDLAPWVNSDFSNYSITGDPVGRTINFNIYNIGSQEVSPVNWSFYFLYYNAYNAQNYGIIFFDQFNTSVAPGTFFCPSGNNCNFNVSIPSGSSFAKVAFNSDFVTRYYEMPFITGQYYLILVADATNVISENNENNNYFYTSFQIPKYFQNGYSFRKDSDDTDFVNAKSFNPVSPHSEFNSAITKQNPNAYSTEEIRKFLIGEKKSGRLQNKINQFKLNSSPYQR